MANCKDCLHQCYTEATEEACNFFVDTTKYVEVVRCKDCKHGKPVDTKVAPFRYYRPECIVCECEDVVGDEPMVYFPTHFCSYGVRKDVDRG